MKIYKPNKDRMIILPNGAKVRAQRDVPLSIERITEIDGKYFGMRRDHKAKRWYLPWKYMRDPFPIEFG